MKEQSIFRVQKDKDNPYVMLNKQFLNDERLSWKAKGVLSYLLSLPDDWKIYEEEISTHSKDSRDSLRSAIKELIQNGYIVRQRTRNERGQLQGSTYCVYEVSTYDGKSNIGFSNVGNPTLLNNNITNNDLTNKTTEISEKDKAVAVVAKRNKKQKKLTQKQLEAAAELAHIEVANQRSG